MKKAVQGRSGRGRTRPVIAGLLAAASVAGAVGVAAAAQGDPNDLRAVGPISTQNGYPIWYRDADGTEVELCLDQDPLCRYLPTDVADPNRPISFPDNYPGETFWWAGESVIEDGLTKKVVLVMAVEAAFASGEVATPGDQVSFGRVRVRMDDMIPGATYHVTHPYGEVDLEADEDGRVFATEDIGALTTPADFSLALDSPVFGNLLQWDADAPAGYLGDPNVEHTVIGSPKDTNFFKVEGPAGSFGPAQACARCDRRQLCADRSVLDHGQACPDVGCADDARRPDRSQRRHQRLSGSVRDVASRPEDHAVRCRYRHHPDEGCHHRQAAICTTPRCSCPAMLRPRCWPPTRPTAPSGKPR